MFLQLHLWGLALVKPVVVLTPCTRPLLLLLRSSWPLPPRHFAPPSAAPHPPQVAPRGLVGVSVGVGSGSSGPEGGSEGTGRESAGLEDGSRGPGTVLLVWGVFPMVQYVALVFLCVVLVVSSGLSPAPTSTTALSSALSPAFNAYPSAPPVDIIYVASARDETVPGASGQVQDLSASPGGSGAAPGPLLSGF